MFRILEIIERSRMRSGGSGSEVIGVSKSGSHGMNGPGTLDKEGKHYLKGHGDT